MSRFRAPALAVGLLALLLAWQRPAGAAAGSHGTHRSRLRRELLLRGPERLGDERGAGRHVLLPVRHDQQIRPAAHRCSRSPRRPHGSASARRSRAWQAFTTYHFRLVVTGATAGNTLSLHHPQDPSVGGDRGGAQPRRLRLGLHGRGHALRAPAAATTVTLQTDPFPFTAAFVQFGNALRHEPHGRVPVPGAGGDREHAAASLHDVGPAAGGEPVVTEQVAVKVSMHAHATKPARLRAPVRDASNRPRPAR